MKSTCGICGGGRQCYCAVETRGGFKVPVCKKCFQRVLTHTKMQCWNGTTPVRNRGLGRPAVKDDPSIKQWATENS